MFQNYTRHRYNIYLKNSPACTERREERGENVVVFKELSQRLITDKTAPP